MALGGCLLAAGAAGGAAGYAYVRGEYTKTVKADVADVTQAAEGALKSMNITVLSSNASAIEGTVKGQTPEEKTVTVTAKSEGQGITNVQIRVGTFGDEGQSKTIMAEIESRL
jgi:phage tail sheath gpL-like